MWISENLCKEIVEKCPIPTPAPPPDPCNDPVHGSKDHFIFDCPLTKPGEDGRSKWCQRQFREGECNNPFVRDECPCSCLECCDSFAPTAMPTFDPTAEPTTKPTNKPTPAPTAEPTNEPTPAPSATPTSLPTNLPTTEPTSAPTTPEPTSEPTEEAPPECQVEFEPDLNSEAHWFKANESIVSFFQGNCRETSGVDYFDKLVEKGWIQVERELNGEKKRYRFDDPLHGMMMTDLDFEGTVKLLICMDKEVLDRCEQNTLTSNVTPARINWFLASAFVILKFISNM